MDKSMRCKLRQVNNIIQQENQSYDGIFSFIWINLNIIFALLLVFFSIISFLREKKKALNENKEKNSLKLEHKNETGKPKDLIEIAQTRKRLKITDGEIEVTSLTQKTENSKINSAKFQNIHINSCQIETPKVDEQKFDSVNFSKEDIKIINSQPDEKHKKESAPSSKDSLIERKQENEYETANSPNKMFQSNNFYLKPVERLEEEQNSHSEVYQDTEKQALFIKTREEISKIGEFKEELKLPESPKVKHRRIISDSFRSLEEVSIAIKNAGLAKCQLIFGIDFTVSNLENGKYTYGGKSLHYFDENIKNPYQKVIEILGKTLKTFEIDAQIPAFGFGDVRTKDRSVFPFNKYRYCNGFEDVLKHYNRITREVELSGPTNFAPLIREAIKIVKARKQYHILVIVADGQVTNGRQTRDAIIEASKYPISIIMVGVGDGPWETMEEFDDQLPRRQFDNFQFLNYHEVTQDVGNSEENFALNALMEIPEQYKAIIDLGLLKFENIRY